MRNDKQAERSRKLRIEGLETRRLLAVDLTGAPEALIESAAADPPAAVVASNADEPGEVAAASPASFPLQLAGIASAPTPTWTDVLGGGVELPNSSGLLTPDADVLAIDLDVTTDSSSPDNEQAPNVADGAPATKYLNFGGEGSGFIATLEAPGAVQSLTLTTANDNASRDPASYILYGTNDPILTEPHGNGWAEEWTEIASGTLSLPNDRLTTAASVGFINRRSFSSYKLIFPTLKNGALAGSMQVADVQFIDARSGLGQSLLTPAATIIPVYDIAGAATSASAAPTAAANAVDGDPATAYVNAGARNSGLIVTPAGGAAVVDALRITTAATAPERDPASWVLYGTNDPIQSTNNSQGTAESWTYIDSGVLSLPSARSTESEPIPVDNAVAYSSYRIAFPNMRQVGVGSVQIGDLQLFTGDAVEGDPASLTIQNGATGAELLSVEAADAVGNEWVVAASADQPASLRVVIEGGSTGLTVAASQLAFEDDLGQRHKVFLPEIDLATQSRLDLWIASDGSTYYGDSSQTSPDFTSLARAAEVLPGDYDLSGVVDEDDYAVWRASYGSTVLLAADGNQDGRVDAADYAVWRDNLGEVAGPGEFSLLPLANPVADNTPLVQWEASSGAAFYDVRIATDPALSNVIVSDTTSGVAYNVPVILSNGDYYVGVTARSSGGFTMAAENNGLGFTVDTPDLLANDGFEGGLVGWQVDQGGADASFSTPRGSSTLTHTNAFFGARQFQVSVTDASTASPASLSTTFYADASQTYLLRWFAQSSVNRAGMKIQVSSEGPAYEQATFNPSSNGWESYHFAFKASGLTTVTFTFEDNSVYALDELQIYDTNSGPDHTGTRMDPERHYLWRWGQTAGASGALTNTDNDISVPLPDGRVLWLFNDTYTGVHDPYDNGSFYQGFTRNFFVIQDGDSLTPMTPGQTTISPGNSTNWYWPNDAFVDGDKLHVVLHEVSPGGFGEFVGSAVATYSLPSLTLDSVSAFTPLNVNKVVDGADGYLYFYGDQSGPGGTGVGRAAKGDFREFSSWEYWNGSAWTSDAGSTVASANLDGAWSVTRIGPDNYMASIPGFVGSTFRASFAPSPLGPWTSSVEIGSPPEPFEAETSFYYMPYLHKDSVQNGVYSIGYSDIGPSGADGDGPFLSNRPGEDQTHYNIQYILTPNLLGLSPYTTNAYTDDFADNDPVEWKSYDGDWAAVAGAYSVQTGAAKGAKSVALGVVVEDLVVEADVSAAGGDAGLIFRGSNYYTGTDNFRGYYAAIKPGVGVVLGRMEDGVWTLLAEAAMTVDSGASYRMRVVAEGDAIEVYVDSMAMPKIAFSDDTFASGSTGLRAFNTNASWDNFAVSDSLPGSAATLVAQAAPVSQQVMTIVDVGQPLAQGSRPRQSPTSGPTWLRERLLLIESEAAPARPRSAASAVSRDLAVFELSEEAEAEPSSDEPIDWSAFGDLLS